MIMDDSKPSHEQSQAALEKHCASVIEWMNKKRVTPFLGAGVNLSDRPEKATYQHGKYLPSGAELAELLAKKFDYSWADKDNLLRVAWYAASKPDKLALYDYLHHIFNADYEPTSVHRFLAGLPKKLKARGFDQRFQTIVTTNYDDMLERAFEDENEEFDLLYFIAEGEDAGLFYHLPFKEEGRVIRNPQGYNHLPIEIGEGNQRTVILKIHGAVNRAVVDDSSFVITEDDYIDYLARARMLRPLPKVLEAELQKHRYLFLGYSLKDWNLRVFLRRIWQGRKLSTKSWAIMDKAEELDELFWRSNDVEVMKLPLKNYIAELERQIQAL